MTLPTFRLANGGSVGGSLNNEGKHEENSKNANILLKKKVIKSLFSLIIIILALNK